MRNPFTGEAFPFECRPGIRTTICGEGTESQVSGRQDELILVLHRDQWMCRPEISNRKVPTILDAIRKLQNAIVDKTDHLGGEIGQCFSRPLQDDFSSSRICDMPGTVRPLTEIGQRRACPGLLRISSRSSVCSLGAIPASKNLDGPSELRWCRRRVQTGYAPIGT